MSSKVSFKQVAIISLVALACSVLLFGCSSGGKDKSSSSAIYTASSKSEEQNKTTEYFASKVKSSNPDDKGTKFSKNNKDTATNIVPEIKAMLGYVEPEKGATKTNLDLFFEKLPKAIENQTIKFSLDYDHTGTVEREFGEDLDSEIKDIYRENPDVKYTLMNFMNSSSKFNWKEDSNGQYTLTFQNVVYDDYYTSSSSSKAKAKTKSRDEEPDDRLFSYSIHAEKNKKGNIVANYNDINNLILCELYASNNIIFADGGWFNKDTVTAFMNNIAAEDVNIIFSQDGEDDGDKEQSSSSSEQNEESQEQSEEQPQEGESEQAPEEQPQDGNQEESPASE